MAALAVRVVVPVFKGVIVIFAPEALEELLIEMIVGSSISQ